MIRDWKDRGSAPGTSTELERSAVAEQMAQFFAAHAEAEKTRKQKCADPNFEHLKSNRLSVEALDHALQSIGLDLQRFRVGVHARGLCLDEERYEVSKEQYPLGFANLKRERRSAICKKSSGERRFEVPLTKEPTRFLHLCMDRGPCQWPMCFWLYTDVGVMGSFMPDPAHMLWGDVEGAVRESGLWGSVLEITLVVAVAAGPWHGCGFLHSMVGASTDYFEMVSEEDDQIMRLLLEPLSLELGLDNPAFFGTPEHFTTLRETVRHRLQTKTKGCKVKAARWFSFFDVTSSLRSERTLDLFILTYIAMRNKWWKSLAESPMCTRVAPHAAGSATDPDPSKAADVSSAGERPRSVKASSAELEKSRQGCKKQLMVAATVLSNNVRRAEMVFMDSAVAPIRADFGEMLVATKTRRGGAASLRQVRVRRFRPCVDQGGFDLDGC